VDQQGNPGRLPYLDLLRVVASYAVVLLHVVAWQVVTLPPSAGRGWWFVTVYDVGMRFCVPVFFMVSGALLLDPGRQVSLGEVFRKRLPKIGIPFLAWACLYYGIYLQRGGDPFVTGDFLRSIARAAGSPHMPPHLWFLPALMGLYLATPFIKPFTDRASTRDLAAFVGLWLAMAILFPLLEYFFDVTVAIRNGLFNIHLGYFVLGTLLHRLPCPSGRNVAWILTPLLLVTWAIGIIGTYMMYAGPGTYYGGFLNKWQAPNVVLLSVCVFLIARCLGSAVLPRHGATARLVAWLGPLTFGIYLAHIVGILLVSPADALFGYLGNAVGMPLRALAAFVVSVLVVVVLRRVPLLRATVP